MSAFFSWLAATGVSATAIYFLRAIDEKRARTLKLKPANALFSVGSPGAARMFLWFGVVSPAIALLALAQYSAFLSWFGGVTVLGWIFALARK